MSARPLTPDQTSGYAIWMVAAILVSVWIVATVMP